MHRLFDADSKGFLTEDEVGALLEVLSDVTDRLGLLPLASQHEIDSMTVEAMTTEDGEYRCVCGSLDWRAWQVQYQYLRRLAPSPSHVPMALRVCHGVQRTACR